MQFFQKQTYSPLDSSDSSVSYTSNDDETTKFIQKKTTNIVAVSIKYGTIWLTFLNTFMFLTSITLFSVFVYERYFVLNSTLRRVSSYSPIYNQFDLGPRIQKVNGTFFPPREPSIARLFPNEAADEIWDEWELRRVYPVTRNDLLRVGVDPTTVVKLNNTHWGLGNDAYAASWDVYHQLHCLNHLRKMVYTDYYHTTLPRARPDKPTKAEIHTNHCIDMLMQALQCSGNVNLISLHWVETQHYPFPNFSIERQCVNFEALTEWRKDKSIDMDKWEEVMKKPEGVSQLPMADAYYELFGKDNPNHVDGASPGEDFNL